MDVIGSYDSDDNIIPSSTPSLDANSKPDGRVDSRSPLPGVSTSGSTHVIVPPSSNSAEPSNGINSPKATSTESQQLHKHADVDTMNVEVLASGESLSSRLHSSYYKSKILSPPGVDTQDVSSPGVTKGDIIALSSESNNTVLSVHIGTRTNSSGVLCVSGSELDTSDSTSAPHKSSKDVERLEAAATLRMRKSLREHTRNADDMVMANYPVDHPMHKTMSVVTKKALEAYGKVGKNFMVLEAESVGGVYVTPCGMTEKTYYDDASFDEQLRLGDHQVAVSHLTKNDSKRRRRLCESEVEGDDVFGPWVPYEEDSELPVADVPITEPPAPVSNSRLPTFETNTRKMTHTGLAFPSCAPAVALPLNKIVIEDGKMETKYDNVVVSTLHKKVDNNSLPTRSWLIPPKNIKTFDPENYKAFLPKKEIYTYTGHSMAVQAIRYIPKTGHCLLSAAMDGFVKIWDANNSRKCLRTYKGHCKGVRDIAFSNPEGSKFYSCGFDSTVIQWDTEYGKVIGAYSIDATPFCVTVHPDDENVFIVGSANKKACQFDARTGKLSIEYNAHQSNVNTATFIDGNRKLVTTGDDKRLVVWEYNIPVPIKQISDPSMHNMPAVVAHPSEKFLLAQAMSNQILVYESSGSRFRFFGGKRFKGHLCSGYAVRPACSPDGRYVVSGDVRGRVFLWDWKTCRNLCTLNGHKSVTMDCQWHPLQPSRLATCSWDGTIKLWD